MKFQDRNATTALNHTGFGRGSLLCVAVLAVLATVLVPTPAAAEHKCDETNPCQSYNHGHNVGQYDRDITDWAPRRFDDAGSDDWHGAYAEGYGPKFSGTEHNYHWTYATGGRLHDSHAAWLFLDARQDDHLPRGIFHIRVRIPKDSAASRNATAAAHYNVEVIKNGEWSHVTSFLIDQRRQQGWVDTGRILTLESKVVRITVSDKQAWPDYAQAGRSNAVLAVDAISLSHAGFLPQDRTYAKLQCVARLSGRPTGTTALAEEAELHLSTGGSFAFSIGAGLLGAALSSPAGLLVGAGIALADPISVLVNGQTLWGAIGDLNNLKQQLDRIAFYNAHTLGGRWERSPEWNWRDPLGPGTKRWYTGSDPGSCELLSRWERYLPDGA